MDTKDISDDKLAVEGARGIDHALRVRRRLGERLLDKNVGARFDGAQRIGRVRVRVGVDRHDIGTDFGEGRIKIGEARQVAPGRWQIRARFDRARAEAGKLEPVQSRIGAWMERGLWSFPVTRASGDCGASRKERAGAGCGGMRVG